MSEKKLFAIKSNDGEWADSHYTFGSGAWATPYKAKREEDAKHHGGHVVTLIEEPEKVKLPKKAAEWIDSVKNGGYDITYIFTEYAMPDEVSDWLEDSDDEAEHREERGLMLINAYLYGYTVAKEKKYLMPMDGTLEENDGYNNYQLYAYCYKGRWLTDECETDPSYLHFTVTQKELETAPAWVKAIKPLEVTDDEK
ncbi:DUF1642 domain-containing protein [Lacticaseibacillus paracasei]|uniref:DUF1642 domain-containing protein n=1 Tax=Lacticaseibacillus paracasei TaxID=1597 RepID=UPI0021B0610A|nr:DUF1642 domain-containing protein [Lacticaseibacillus paracasei]UWY23609.1 DUF1642 domain-containing protein [Lacticaseibacillus paracasei]